MLQAGCNSVGWWDIRPKKSYEHKIEKVSKNKVFHFRCSKQLHLGKKNGLV